MPIRRAVLLLAAALLGCGRDPGTPGEEPEDRPPPDMLAGGDISFLPTIEQHGGTYRDAAGARDLPRLLADHGWDAVRLRLWHTPTDAHSGLPEVLALARRTSAAGLQLLLDIHYSDTWADPGQQTKPTAWTSLPFDVLTDSVYRYTRDVVGALKDQGTLPTMVQLGNEIRPGMLWPDGRVDGSYNQPAQWDRLVTLLHAARRGVLEAAGAQPPLLMIHLDHGGDNLLGRYFFDELKARGLEYDVIGVSYYPKWHGTLGQLGANLADLSARYARDVYVVETAYPWTLDWKDGTANSMGTSADLLPAYPATPQGQADFLRSLRLVLGNVPGGRGKGVFYWAPEWLAIPGVHSSWENATLFDFDGKALPALDTLAGGH